MASISALALPMALLVASLLLTALRTDGNQDHNRRSRRAMAFRARPRVVLDGGIEVGIAKGAPPKRFFSPVSRMRWPIRTQSTDGKRNRVMRAAGIRSGLREEK